MKPYTFTQSQKLPISLREAWEYFSNPHNLKAITPPYMGFDITESGLTQRMYPGMIISYVVRPFLHLPLSWTTEITHVNEPNYFVDEQRFGPYRFWHHKHFFHKNENGILMYDVVHYLLPLGPLGRIIHPWLVRPRLEQIFAYRYQKLEQLFSS